MPELDPEMAGILAEMADRQLQPLESMTAADARAEAEVRNAYWNEDPPALADVRMLTIAGPRGQLRLRLYAPPGGGRGRPCVLYIHGGGWVICSLETHDGICRRLALAGGFMVASVDYGLAPEHPYPHGLGDCLAAIRWLAEHGAAEGVDPTRLALAGDSAGANLALASCIALRDQGTPLVRAAALVYGVFSADNDSPSHVAFGDGRYILSTPAMAWFWDHYVKDPARRGDPLAAPLNAELRGLPPLYVSAAELDPLRDDSERLARRLVDAGVDHDFRLWRGVTHACFGMSRRLAAARGFIDETASFLARRLG
jgi:acetyl esterase